MKKARAVFAGLVFLGMCLIIFPYFNDYILQPAYEAAQTLVPGMSDLNNFIWLMLPWGVLFFIFFGSIMIMLGKVGGGDDEGDDKDAD